MNLYCFICDYYVALISALVLLKCSNLRSSLKIDWGSPPGFTYIYYYVYLRNAYYVLTFCCFTQVFVDSAYKQLIMALSQAHNLLRRTTLSGDLTDDCVNNFMSFFE